ncbi:MAG: ABC transporter ATP-binding protein [Candidatus Poribacteria bacterium]|nr:ABC transporter ATP-binding protein [Candidatus Poribacteria bacterium]MDE0503572.1 ABC transporter ATP-binding protein [Candidatus Poribacteria bacterium]
MLLQATKITKRFGHRTILDEVEIKVQPGEVVSILGPNGAGKTTLIKILSTLIKPGSGDLCIAGTNALENALHVRPSLGVVVHEPLAYLEFTPYENLAFFGKMYAIDSLERRINTLLGEVGLAQFAHDQMRVFSRGMIQRFMIAKSLIHNPTLLLLDEPFSGLDVAAKQFVLDRIHHERSQGKGIVLTTHDTELAYIAGSRFLFLLNADLKAVAQKDEIAVDELAHRYEQDLKQHQMK